MAGPQKFVLEPNWELLDRVPGGSCVKEALWKTLWNLRNKTLIICYTDAEGKIQVSWVQSVLVFKWVYFTLKYCTHEPQTPSLKTGRVILSLTILNPSYLCRKVPPWHYKKVGEISNWGYFSWRWVLLSFKLAVNIQNKLEEVAICSVLQPCSFSPKQLWWISGFISCTEIIQHY